MDYATDNITVYRSCPYGCRYCWAWRLPLFAKRISAGKYDPVEEARRYLRKREPRTIVVSFTSDPYPRGVEEATGRTRRVLEVLAEAKWHKVIVLTKNPLTAATRDLDLFTRNRHMWLGTTVITLSDDIAGYWEPNAPPPSTRLWALEHAHKHGVNTWLSIEPIIPETTWPEEIVEKTIDYVDWYVLGAFNYAPRLGYTEYTMDLLREWYLDHVVKAIELLRRHGKPFFIKKELRKYLPREVVG